jgi:hypothetical protein
MQVHRLIRPRSVVAFLGIALGTALGTAALPSSPTAAADPISDWPYGGFPGGAELPGFVDASTITNQQSEFVGLGTLTTQDFDYDVGANEGPGGPDWYSVSDSNFVVPGDLYENDYQQVTSVLDDTPGYPSVGTVADQSEAFILNSPAINGVPLITTDSLDDPNLGSAESISFPGLENLLVTDSAGVEDVVTAFGQSYTLFDLPTTDAAAGASDLSQLMAEFSTLF